MSESRKVLLVTDGLVHPPLLARKNLVQALVALDGFHFEHIRSLENLPEKLTEFSAVVLYFHHKGISEKALARLRDFVAQGGGVLALHSATASFKEQLGYFDILGGRFTGHGKVEKFEVRRVKDEIFGGIESFVVKDELYLHETQSGIDVHFTARHEGKDIPAVWTYQYGKGRICYAVGGHRTETMKNESYQKILQRGLIWVSKYEQT